MLQEFHDKIKGFVAWFVVILIAFAFITWGIRYYLEGSKTPTVVKVNGTKITEPAVQASSERLLNQLRQQYGPNYVPNDTMQKNIRKQAISQLVLNTVLTKQIDKLGLQVDEERIKQTIMSVDAFQVEKRFSPQRYQAVLAQAKLTPSQFESDLRNDMLTAQLRNGLTKTAFSPNTEASLAVGLVDQVRDFEYLVIPNSLFNDVKLKEETLKSFYDKNKAQFVTQEKLSIEYVTLDLNNYIKKQTVSEQEIKAFYEENKANYETPGQWKVAHILVKAPSGTSKSDVAAAQEKIKSIADKLAAGEKFAALAKEYSDDVLTAKKGGELPWLSANTVDPSFANVMVKLNKKGEISQPVKTKYGFTIMKLIDIKPVTTTPLSKLKKSIKQQLQQRLAQKQYSSDLEELNNLIYVNPESLTPAANELGLKVQSTDKFSRAGLKTGIASNAKVVTLAYSDDVIAEGNNSKAIELSPGKVIALRIKEHDNAQPKPYAAVKKDIAKGLLNLARQQKANELGGKLLSLLNNQKKSEAKKLLTQYKLTWDNASKVGRRDQDKVNPIILNAAFKVSDGDNKEPIYFGLPVQQEGFALIALKNITEGNYAKLNNNEKKQINQQLANHNGQLEYSLYIQHLMKEAKIKNYLSD